MKAGLLLVACVVACAGLVNADIIPCSTPKNLVAKCGGLSYDLSNMKTAQGSYTFSTTTSQYTYTMRLLSGGVDLSKLSTCSNIPAGTKNVGMVQIRLDGGGCYSLGTTTSQSWGFNDQTKDLEVTVTGGDNGRAASIRVACDPNAKTSTLNYVGESLGNNYSFGMSYKGACGSSSAPTANKSKKDVGAILVIIFFVLIIVYLLVGGGILFSKGQRGAELIPQKTVWISLWGLIKDGNSFVIGKIRGGTGATASYSQI